MKKKYLRFLDESNKAKFKDYKKCKIVNECFDLNTKDKVNLFFVDQYGSKLSQDKKIIFNEINHSGKEIFKVKNNIFIIYKKGFDDQTDMSRLFSIIAELQLFLHENRINKKENLVFFEDIEVNIFDIQLIMEFIFKEEDKIFKFIKNEQVEVHDEIEIEEIIKYFHDSKILSGHAGYARTASKIAQFYKIKNLTNLVRNFVKRCPNCQKNKTTNKKPNIMRVTSTCYSKFEKVHCDLVGPLPESQEGYKYVVSLMDQFSRHVTFIPIKNMTSDTIAEAIVNNYILIYGPMQILITDNAANLNSEVMKKIENLLGIKKLNTTIYYPQSNNIERIHGTLKNFLRAYLDSLGEINKWPELLKFFAYNYNTNTNVTGYTPYYIVFGEENRVIESDISYLIEDNYNIDSYVNKLKNSLKIVYEKTREYNIKQKENRIKEFNLKATDFCLNIGDKVKMKLHHTGVGNKLKSIFSDPAEVIEIMSPEYVKIKYKDRELKMNKNNLYPYYDEE